VAKPTLVERFRAELKSLAVESRAWRPIHERATFGVQFLIDGRHYSDSIEASTDSDDIRWVGEEGFNRLRHEIGAVMVPGTLTAKPVDMAGSNPDLQDFAVRLMTGETELPENEEEESWYDVLECASAAAYGVNWLDYLPEEDQIVSAADDPRNFMCDRRVRSVHSKRCRFVYRKMRMTIGEVKRRMTEGSEGARWNKALMSKLRADDDQAVGFLDRLGTPGGEETTQWVRLRQDSFGPEGSDDDKEVTVYVKWSRYSDETEDESDYTEYEPGQRYMRCTSCGYRTATQEQMGQNGQPQDLPEELGNSCPECMASPDSKLHGNMIRIDGEERTVEMLKYPKGYLCIFAPFALPGVEDFLYEGPWPWKLRSYPCALVQRFRHPFKIIGPSLSDLLSWNQSATDMMMRMVLERMVVSEPAPLMPEDAIFDSQGMPWETSSNRTNGAFYRGMTMPATAMIGGDPGIPQMWPLIMNAARSMLTASEGIADFSLTEGQTRNIPAQSVALQVRQEEIPLADLRKRYHRERGKYTGVRYDMMKAIYSPDRLYAIAGRDESDQVQQVAITDLPNFSFRYDAGPTMEPQDEVASAATQLLIGTIEQRPWAVELVASANKIAPSLVRKAMNDYKTWQSQQGAPPVPIEPPALLQAIASLAKAGIQLSPNQIEAALAAAQLPPPNGPPIMPTPNAAAPAAAAGSAGGSVSTPPGTSPQNEQPSSMVEKLLSSIGSQQQ
jgi:hypothetical protein